MSEMERSGGSTSEPVSSGEETGPYGDAAATGTYDTTTGSLSGTAGTSDSAAGTSAYEPTGTAGTTGAAGTAGTTGTGTADTSAFASSADTSAGAGQSGREWVGQLQGMIDNVATQAAPVLREIAAKAAELAAAAGEKAGPFAHRAAEVTEAAGAKLAERGREVASDLRRGEGAEGQGAAAGDTPNTIDPGSSTLSGTESTYPTDTSRTVGE